MNLGSILGALGNGVFGSGSGGVPDPFAMLGGMMGPGQFPNFLPQGQEQGEGRRPPAWQMFMPQLASFLGGVPGGFGGD